MSKATSPPLICRFFRALLVMKSWPVWGLALRAAHRRACSVTAMVGTGKCCGGTQFQCNAEQVLARGTSPLWAVCCVANPRHSFGYDCVLRLAAPPKPERAASRGLIQRRPESGLSFCQPWTSPIATLPALVSTHATTGLLLTGKARAAYQVGVLEAIADIRASAGRHAAATLFRSSPVPRPGPSTQARLRRG